MAGNVFDQFDGGAAPQQAKPATSNVFDQFDPPPQKTQTWGEFFQNMFQADEETRRLGRQGVSPHVFSQYAPVQPRLLGHLASEPETNSDTGNIYRGINQATGKEEELRFNPSAEFYATDPKTGKLAVFARHEKSLGDEAYNLTHEGALTRLAREIVPGLMAGPVTGIQKGTAVTNAAGAAERLPISSALPPAGVRAAAPTIAAAPAGTTSAALATERAANAVRDAQAFKNLEVRPFGPAFSSGPTASVAKQLSETYLLGAPIRNALEDTYKGLSNASTRIGEALAPSASMEATGVALQRGLDRFRTAGVRDLEPAILERMGIQPMAPVQRGVAMSGEAAKRAEQAAQIRQAAGETPLAATSRGVSVPAARPLEQTFLARRGAEDMGPLELQRIIRAPSNEVSFAAKQEALFEHAWQQLPSMFKIDNSANPNLIRAVNTNNAFRQMAAMEQRAGISGGIVGGRFSDMAAKVANNTTLPSLKAMRTEVGRALSNFGVYDARLDRTQLKHLYGALSRDIEVGVMDLANRARIATQRSNNRPDAMTIAAARQAEGALYALRRADRYTRMGMERMDRFAKVVGTDNPQAAAGFLVRAAQDGAKGNMQMLRTAVGVLRPEEQNQLAALVFRELGKPKPGAGGIVQEVGFSAESALTRWNAMNPEARRLLFGGELSGAIDDFVRVVSRIANVEKLANTSRSATNALNITGLVGGVSSAASGNFLMPAILGGSGLGASVIFSRPSYVRWATEYAKLRAAVLRAPVGTAAPRLNAAVNQLGQMAKHDPALLPVFRAVADENGVSEHRRDQKRIKQ